MIFDLIINFIVNANKTAGFPVRLSATFFLLALSTDIHSADTFFLPQQDAALKGSRANGLDSVNFCSSNESKVQRKDDVSKWDASVDILFWKANQTATWATNLDFMPYVTSEGASAVKFIDKEQVVQFPWDVGIRVGLGHSFKHNSWDVQLFYTWFHTKGKDHSFAPTSDENVTSSFLGNWLTFGFAGNEGHIQWNIVLNAFDAEIGRHCLAGKGLFFRPYFGIKAGWIHQSIHSQWIARHTITAKENLKNNFWGVGPKGGIDTKWNIISSDRNSFHLFGDTSLTLLGGRWTFKDSQTTSMNSAISSHNPAVTSGTFVYQALAGLGWDIQFDRNKSHFGARVGYELQYWFDQLKIFTFLEGTLHSPLVFQGGMLDLHFDY